MVLAAPTVAQHAASALCGGSREIIQNPGLSGFATARNRFRFTAPRVRTARLTIHLGQTTCSNLNLALLVVAVIATARFARKASFIVNVWVLLALAGTLPALATGMLAGGLSGID
jgi:hypothetical protein